MHSVCDDRHAGEVHVAAYLIIWNKLAVGVHGYVIVERRFIGGNPFLEVGDRPADLTRPSDTGRGDAVEHRTPLDVIAAELGELVGAAVLGDYPGLAQGVFDNVAVRPFAGYHGIAARRAGADHLAVYADTDPVVCRRPARNAEPQVELCGLCHGKGEFYIVAVGNIALVLYGDNAVLPLPVDLGGGVHVDGNGVGGDGEDELGHGAVDAGAHAAAAVDAAGLNLAPLKIVEVADALVSLLSREAEVEERLLHLVHVDLLVGEQAVETEVEIHPEGGAAELVVLLLRVDPAAAGVEVFHHALDHDDAAAHMLPVAAVEFPGAHYRVEIVVAAGGAVEVKIALEALEFGAVGVRLPSGLLADVHAVLLPAHELSQPPRLLICLNGGVDVLTLANGGGVDIGRRHNALERKFKVLDYRQVDAAVEPVLPAAQESVGVLILAGEGDGAETVGQPDADIVGIFLVGEAGLIHRHEEAVLLGGGAQLVHEHRDAAAQLVVVHPAQRVAGAHEEH